MRTVGTLNCMNTETNSVLIFFPKDVKKNYPGRNRPKRNIHDKHE